MQWTLVIQNETGELILRTEGTGGSGSVTWDGMVDGVAVPIGQYLVRIDAVPVSGAPAPRFSTFFFRVGFNPPFRDDEGSIHESDINQIAGWSITKGCGPELYCPNGTVTRWQMALFLTRLHSFNGFSLPDGSERGFTDITGLPPDYQLAINQLSELGITQGTSPTTFDPGATVTRWQMALFLTRLLRAEGVVLPDGSNQGFADIIDLPPDHQTAINQLRQMNVTNQDGEYHPHVVMPRNQMASFLARSSTNIQSTQGASGCDGSLLFHSGPGARLLIPTGAPAVATGQLVHFEGSGWGHGVGMSQYGSHAMATAGMTAEQILTYYYSGTTVKPAVQALDPRASCLPTRIRCGLDSRKTRLPCGFRSRTDRPASARRVTGKASACLR